jgi:dTMP kinase
MTTPIKKGKFITLEGVDGAGKSSHIPAIIEILQHNQHQVTSTREPGGTPLGEKLRALLLHEEMHAETETLLMFAARREHIACVIEPAFARGETVVSDRFTDASFAYQSGAKGVNKAKLESLEDWVHAHLQPDHTLLFDVPVEVSMARLANAREPDKFEREQADFFIKIRESYLARAKQFPTRFHIIDSNQPFEDVKQCVYNIVSTF